MQAQWSMLHDAGGMRIFLTCHNSKADAESCNCIVASLVCNKMAATLCSLLIQELLHGWKRLED